MEWKRKKQYISVANATIEVPTLNRAANKNFEVMKNLLIDAEYYFYIGENKVGSEILNTLSNYIDKYQKSDLEKEEN